MRLRWLRARLQDRCGRRWRIPEGEGSFAKGVAMSSNRVIGIREQDEIEETIAVLAIWVMQMASPMRSLLNDRALEAANIACTNARETLRKLLEEPNGKLDQMIAPLLVRHARKAEIASVVIRHKDEPPNSKG
jgi:hypothetical protein